jgi:hypothetical protein
MCARLGKQLHLLGMSLGDRPAGRDAQLIDFDKVGNGPRVLDGFPLIQQFATEDCVFRRELATALHGAHTPGIRRTRMCCLISSWPRFILAASGSANWIFSALIQDRTSSPISVSSVLREPIY